MYETQVSAVDMHKSCASLSMAYLRKKPIGTHTVIDGATGELLNCVEHTRTELIKDKEAFCLIYAKYLSIMEGFSAAEGKLLSWCCLNATLNTNMVTLNKYYKEQAAAAMGINKRTIENAIVTLQEQQALVRIASGVYRVDPEISWKGTMAERTKVLRIHLEWKIQNP